MIVGVGSSSSSSSSSNNNNNNDDEHILCSVLRESTEVQEVSIKWDENNFK